MRFPSPQTNFSPYIPLSAGVQGVAGAAHPSDGRVAAVYRLVATLSPGTGGLRSQVEFHRRGRFDATITLHDGRKFGVVRQGLALRRRSLYDRLRAIAEYDYWRRPGAVLILTPSVWEQGLMARFCMEVNLSDFYVAVESRKALERRDYRGLAAGLLRVWQFLPHLGVRKLPGQRQPKTCRTVAGPQAGLDTAA